MSALRGTGRARHHSMPTEVPSSPSQGLPLTASPNGSDTGSGYGFDLKSLGAGVSGHASAAGSALLPLLDPLPVFGSPPGSPGQEATAPLPPEKRTSSRHKKRRRTSAELTGVATTVLAAPTQGGTIVDPRWSEPPLVRDEEQMPGWTPNSHEMFCRIFDAHMAEIPMPSFHVQIDKGFKRCRDADAFICQKKNHFQVTISIQLPAEPAYVATPSGMQRVNGIFILMHGMKVDQPHKHVQLEQSQADRSKKPFKPVPLSLLGNEMCRVTIGRLHFSEPTSNNMRKKGKPNPDQKFFALVVSMAARAGDQFFTIVSHMSDAIIVRASNPRQFEGDNTSRDKGWARGVGDASVFHMGPVGINTEAPDEALCVDGNLRLSGAILQPSDARLKTDIQRLDTATQLDHILRLNLYQYRFLPGFKHADVAADEVGFLAQEVEEVMPDAVHTGGHVRLAGGEAVNDLKLVNKERILMEAVGAMQQLHQVTVSLANRVELLEEENRKLRSSSAAMATNP